MDKQNLKDYVRASFYLFERSKNPTFKSLYTNKHRKRPYIVCIQTNVEVKVKSDGFKKGQKESFEINFSFLVSHLTLKQINKEPKS